MIDYDKYKLPKYPNNISNKLIRFNPSNRKWILSNPKEKVNTYNKIDNKYPTINNPDIELFRYKIYNKLKNHCINKILNKYIESYKKRKDLFDIWHWYFLTSQSIKLDPLIPYEMSIKDQSIYNIFEQHKIKNIEDVLLKINTFSKKCCLELNNYIQNYKDIKSINVQYEILEDYKIYYGGLELYINKLDIIKLQKWYGINETNSFKFYNALFCMMLRYYTIGDTTSQAALPKNIFNILQTKYKIQHECFASPLNAYFSSYCSGFYDTDKYFGSVGSFFKFYPKSGFYEVNPPFNEIVMQKMVEHIEYLIYNSNNNLAFLVIIPKWNDIASPMWQSLTNSRYKKLYFDILANKHHYYKGNKYRIKNEQMWMAKHTTSIFLLYKNISDQMKIKIKDIEKEIKSNWK